jgi:hypothetical protein
MDFITHVQAGIMAVLPGIIASYAGQVTAESLSEMEVSVKRMTHAVGNAVMQQWLEAQDEKYPERQQACECGGQAEYVRRREGMVITLQGRVYYRRAYYLCEKCGGGYSPLDRRLGVKAGQMSEEVIKQAALVGIQDAFGAAQQTLAELTLLELSPSSSQLEQRRKDKPRRLYGSLDGFMVPLEDGWHEMKGGVWWATIERRDGSLAARDLSYYVDLLPAETFADLVWATQIVDWYHACQYLAPVAEAAFTDPTQRDAWVEQTKAALWEGRLDEVIAACRQQLQSNRPDDPAQKAVTYCSNNRHRMDYPTYRAKGYMIGSGSMESACKQIGLERLKIAGARWTPRGAHRIAKARAAYLSGQWHNLTPSCQVA